MDGLADGRCIVKITHITSLFLSFILILMYPGHHQLKLKQKNMMRSPAVSRGAALADGGP